MSDDQVDDQVGDKVDDRVDDQSDDQSDDQADIPSLIDTYELELAKLPASDLKTIVEISNKRFQGMAIIRGQGDALKNAHHAAANHSHKGNTTTPLLANFFEARSSEMGNASEPMNDKHPSQLSS